MSGGASPGWGWAQLRDLPPHVALLVPVQACGAQARAVVGRVRRVVGPDRIADPDFLRRQGLVSYLGLPLTGKDETLGVLSFYTKEKHQFSGGEVEFFQTLAGEAAVAISNSQLYERVKNLADELAASNRVKDEFLSIMSHELRTPISLIMGYTAMLADGAFGETNPDQKNTLAKLTNFAQDLLTMVNSMLYITAVETQLVKAEKRVAFVGYLLDQLR